jgi:hypothetical protein
LNLPRELHSPQAAQLRVNLLRGLLPDMAGVEHHHVGFGRVVGLRVSVMRKGLGHALAVIDVHLTAVSLDKDLPGLCHAKTSQLLSGGSRPRPRQR